MAVPGFRAKTESRADELITPLSAEATHTLVVPLAMFVHCLGDFKKSVIACVMYARDDDSYTSVAGALAGAYRGVDVIPEDRIATVINANPETDIVELSTQLTQIIIDELGETTKSMNALV